MSEPMIGKRVCGIDDIGHMLYLPYWTEIINEIDNRGVMTDA